MREPFPEGWPAPAPRSVDYNALSRSAFEGFDDGDVTEAVTRYQVLMVG